MTDSPDMGNMENMQEDIGDIKTFTDKTNPENPAEPEDLPLGLDDEFDGEEEIFLYFLGRKGEKIGKRVNKKYALISKLIKTALIGVNNKEKNNSEKGGDIKEKNIGEVRNDEDEVFKLSVKPIRDIVLKNEGLLAHNLKFNDDDVLRILGYVVEYMNNHKGVFDKEKDVPEAQLRSKNMNDVMSELDAGLLDKIRRDNGTKGKSYTYFVLLVAHYLDIEGLLMISSAYVASWLKNVPREDYMKALDPTEPYIYTPDENCEKDEKE